MNNDPIRYKNEQYAWLCAQSRDVNNDVTESFNSDDPERELFVNKSQLTPSLYATAKTFSHKSGVAVIRETIEPKYPPCIDHMWNGAFIIESVNDPDMTFPSKDSEAIASISAGIYCLPRGIAPIIWTYAKAPICKMTMNVGGRSIIMRDVYSFPFSDFPDDPIPSVSLSFHQMRLLFDPPLPRFTVTIRRIMIKNDEDGFMKPFRLPGYNAISAQGMWQPLSPSDV